MEEGMEGVNRWHRREMLKKIDDDERRSISVIDHDQVSMSSYKNFVIDYDEIQ